MTTRSNGPLAGFGWLKRGFSISFHHPKPLFGGAVVLLLASFLPSLITLPIQFSALHAGVPLSPAFSIWTTAIAVLYGLLLVPLWAGYFQVIDAAEHGLSARARDIFKPYRQGEALRLIGYGLTVLVFYVAIFALIILTVGRGVASWYMHMLATPMNPKVLPTLPNGFGVTVALFLVLSLFMLGFYAISLGQVALHRRGVFAAIGDGVSGALKNLLPLFVYAVSIFLAFIVVLIGVVIVAVLLTLLAKFVGLWLMYVLVVPLYIALILIVYAVMFGVMYQVWRDVCGQDGDTHASPTIAA